MSCDAEYVTFLFRKFWLLNRAFRFLSRTFKFLSRTLSLGRLSVGFGIATRFWLLNRSFWFLIHRSFWFLKSVMLVAEAGFLDCWSGRRSLFLSFISFASFVGLLGFSALERNTVCLEELSIFRGDTASRTALPWRKIAAYEWKVYCEMKTSLPREHCIFYMKSSECAAIKGYQRVVLAAVWK